MRGRAELVAGEGEAGVLDAERGLGGRLGGVGEGRERVGGRGREAVERLSPREGRGGEGERQRQEEGWAHHAVASGHEGLDGGGVLRAEPGGGREVLEEAVAEDGAAREQRQRGGGELGVEAGRHLRVGLAVVEAERREPVVAGRRGPRR